MYADWAYYSGEYGGTATQQAITPMLNAANDACDALTFSRIIAIGWENLTELQQDLIQRFCCAQADFLLENGDAVNSAMQSYSINGVSMTFGNPALYSIQNGVAVSNAAFELLKRTGLTSLMFYPPEVDRALA